MSVYNFGFSNIDFSTKQLCLRFAYKYFNTDNFMTSLLSGNVFKDGVFIGMVYPIKNRVILFSDFRLGKLFQILPDGRTVPFYGKY